MGPFTDLDFIGSDIDALAVQIIQFLDQYGRVNHHSVTDDARFALENSGRHQMADKLFAINHHGMAGIVSALKTDDRPCIGGQKVNDLSLALIAPLGTDDYNISQL